MASNPILRPRILAILTLVTRCLSTAQVLPQTTEVAAMPPRPPSRSQWWCWVEMQNGQERITKSGFPIWFKDAAYWSREDLAGLEDHYIESETTSYDELGVAKYYDLKWGDTVLKDAAWFYPEPKAVDGVETEILKDQVTFRVSYKQGFPGFHWTGKVDGVYLNEDWFS